MNKLLNRLARWILRNFPERAGDVVFHKSKPIGIMQKDGTLKVTGELFTHVKTK